jgi:hypothetical protein
MGDILSSRAGKNIAGRYGRDSVYAVSAHSTLVEVQRAARRGLLRRTKAYNAVPFGKTPPFGLNHFGKSIHALPADYLEPYGRAGGYIGCGKVALVRPLPRALTSGCQDGSVVKNGGGHEKTPAALRPYDVYRRDPALWDGKEVNLISPVGDERLSDLCEKAASAGNKKVYSALAWLSKPAVLRVDDQLRSVQGVDGTSGMNTSSGYQQEPNGHAQRKPALFIDEQDTLTTARRQSAEPDATDSDSGPQSEPIVRALPEQASLRPEEQSDLNVEEGRFNAVPVDSSGDTNQTNNADLDGADADMVIIHPLTAPSESELESSPTGPLREEVEGGAIQNQSAVEDLPAGEITITVVDPELSMHGIRISKRVSSW